MSRLAKKMSASDSDFLIGPSLTGAANELTSQAAIVHIFSVVKDSSICSSSSSSSSSSS
jgi:hypothetical protein